MPRRQPRSPSTARLRAEARKLDLLARTGRLAPPPIPLAAAAAGAYAVAAATDPRTS
jgi:hypothetical protein